MAITEASKQALGARIERGSLAAWPALETTRDGEWLWLYAKGYTKRANSIRAMDRKDDARAKDRLIDLAQRSRQYAIAPMFRVTELTGPGVLAGLDELGWVRFDDTLVLARPLGGARQQDRLERGAGANWHKVALTDPGFLAGQARLQGYGAPTAETLAKMSARMERGAGLWLADPQGQPVASLLLVFEDGIAHITNVITAQKQRRKGFARALMQAGLDVAREEGCDYAALAVLAENLGARALYHRLGFEPVSAYHYRKGE